MSVFLSNTHTHAYMHGATTPLQPCHFLSSSTCDIYVHVGMGKLHFFYVVEKNKNIQVESRIQPYTPPQFGFTCGAIAS